MAYSIETRIPFLDHRIVELMFGVHKDLKMSGYTNKVVLRNAVASRTLPRELLAAPKKGFSVPLRDWFKEDNLTKTIHDLLIAKNDNAVYLSDGVEKLINQNRDGSSDAGNFLWMMVVLKKWMDTVKPALEIEESKPVLA